MKNLYRFLKSFLPQGYKQRVKNNFGVPSLNATLLRLKAKGYKPGKVIDGGAYEGEWTKDFLLVFPDAEILMIEPQETKRGKLQSLLRISKSVLFAGELIGAEHGMETPFLQNETASHVLSAEEAVGKHVIYKSTTTLDELTKKLNFYPVDFLKLDVQGHEASVLKGAGSILSTAQFCLLELTLIDIGDNTELFAEMILLMDNYDFQVYDIAQFMRRPYDQALYQADILFIKKQNPLIGDKRWK